MLKLRHFPVFETLEGKQIIELLFSSVLVQLNKITNRIYLERPSNLNN